MAKLLRRLAGWLVSFDWADDRPDRPLRGPLVEMLEYDLAYYDAIGRSLIGDPAAQQTFANSTKARAETSASSEEHLLSAA